MCDLEDATSKLSALANRRRAATLGSLGTLMKELLLQLDPDYFRSVQLLIAQAEVERLRKWRLTL